LFNYLIKKKMKKLVLLLAVVFSVSLFSCGGSDKKAAEDTVAADTVAPATEVVTPDSTNCDSINCDSVCPDSVKA